MGQWVEVEVRDSVVGYVQSMSKRAEILIKDLIKQIGIPKAKYHSWVKRYGKSNNHNGKIPKHNWLIPSEVNSIVEYAKSVYSNNDFFIKNGYRRLTYTMIDNNVVYASCSSVYRVLKRYNLLNKWNTAKSGKKGKGFNQPTAPHQHWHTDIKYVTVNGQTVFLISVIDGYSRYIVHNEVRVNMNKSDCEIVIQRAKEKYPNAKPRIITDNGSQYISKDFKIFITNMEMSHVRTSVNYPQANGKIERFHRTISEECLRLKYCDNIEQLRKSINYYVDYYNHKRLHSALNYLTPYDYLCNLNTEKLRIRDQKLHEAEINRTLYWSNHEKVA